MSAPWTSTSDAKLGAAANIRTVPGVGYALDPPKAD